MTRRLSKLRSAISSVMMRNYLRPEARRKTNMVVCGFPKSGTTWVSQLCAGYFNLEYTRNAVRFQRKNTLLHTHSVRFEGTQNIVYVVRDPRECICSAARTISKNRLNEVFDEEGRILPEFADFVIDGFPGATTSMPEHLRTALDKGWATVRFEDLKIDALEAMKDLIASFGGSVDQRLLHDVTRQFDFSRLKSARQHDKFLAQSSMSSWTDLLPEPVLELVWQRVGPLAESFGYTCDSMPR